MLFCEVSDYGEFMLYLASLSSMSIT